MTSIIVGSDPVEHELKCDPFPYDNIVKGFKAFELRRDDRPGGFKVGDTLKLREHDRIKMSYTGRWCRCLVRYVLRTYDGLQAGYAILSITVLESHE